VGTTGWFMWGQPAVYVGTAALGCPVERSSTAAGPSSAILPRMARKPRIAIVGAGNLGTAVAVSLHRAGYQIEAIISRRRRTSLTKARKLAAEVGAQAVGSLSKSIQADVVWFCVPDSEIARAAESFTESTNWKGRVALHSSGALTSDELALLRKKGAAVASAHPLMTFVRGSRPSLAGVPFAIEGDAPAVRAARHLVKDFGGHFYSIRKTDKAAYHAWGMFASPLFTALLVTAEQVAGAAGVNRQSAWRRMIPILLQTLANYASFDAKDAFSGPIVRGDVETVKRHLRVLRRVPEARDVYVALARAALRHLPAKKKTQLEKALIL
jgi:predicted short-subunit dehydrogenase-like oxidoreductase (DUF2520 family)